MLERAPSRAKLHELLRRHPADLAEMISALSAEEAVELVRRLYARGSAAPLGEMEPEKAARLVAHLDREEAIRILSQMDPDDAADLLAELPPATMQDILSRLESSRAQTLRMLLSYPPDTAAGLMSPEVLALPANLRAREALRFIRRKAHEMETVYYAYVVDEGNRLLGVLSLRDLVLATLDTPVTQIMNPEVVTLAPDMDVEEVARLFDKYNFLALPVVDQDKKLLGIVTVDDVMDVMREEATEDLLRVGGIPAGEDLPLDPPLSSVKKRLPWLMGLVVLDLSVAGLVSRFEATIAELAFVTALMPLIADMSGNAAAQALTVAIRGMALGLVDWKDLPKILWKELRVGLLAGLGLGGQIGLIATLLWKKPLFGVVAGLALVGTAMGACLTGGAIPFLFKKLRLDPAMMSGPVATTVGDLIGISLFLGLATLFRSRLL
ncbi:MAG: magnesium transporter [Candidatus Bipolaricaulaceae bacterium]